MLEKIYFLYFSIYLAISTQLVNYLLVVLKIDTTYSILKQAILSTSILLPLILILNVSFTIYYKHYTKEISYSTLYMAFILISIIVSFFVQYLIQGSVELKVTNVLGFVFALIGMYLIIN